MPRGPYVLYARKSTESEDRQVLSIDSQVRELQLLATRQGFTVAEVLMESKSAKAPGRPVFGELMRRVERGQVAGVLCWKMDRLARNHLDHGRVLQALAEGKLEKVVTIDRTYTGDGNDRFIGNFELGMATKYIDDLRANVKRGNRARREQGWCTHLPPQGYRIEPETKHIVKDPERFDLVRRMWDLLLTGNVRPAQVLKIANEQWGFRTRRWKSRGGAPLSISGLYAMFANPFYAGILRLRATGETWKGRHPPMISKDEYDHAQELLGRPNNVRPKYHEFPFTGLIRCGGCNGMVTAEVHVKRSGKRYVYYHCGRRKAGTTCREPLVSSVQLEEQIAAHLSRLTLDAPALSLVLRLCRRGVQTEQARRQQVHESLVRALDGLKREEQNLVDLRLREFLTDEVFVERRGALQERRVGLELKLSASERSPEETAEEAIATFRFAANAERAFRSGTPVQKRTVLALTGSNPVLKDRKLALEFKNPFRWVAETGSNSEWCSTVKDVRTWLAERPEYFKLPDWAYVEPKSTMPVAA
jgi:DNA invertase Pin-like site-specific DNA recombinase